jgi:non-homologous end joining protein Ku
MLDLAKYIVEQNRRTLIRQNLRDHYEALQELLDKKQKVSRRQDGTDELRSSI